MPRSGRRAAGKPRGASSYSRSMREEHAFRWRYALLIVLVALAFRGAYMVEAAREPSWNLLYLDEEYHVGRAKSLATQDWSPPYDELRAAPYFRAPLYPYFLAGVFRLFGGGLLIPRLIQILIGSLSCALAYALGTKCFDQRVGLITGFVCALYWVLAYHDAEFLLPVLLVFLVLLGFVLAFAAAERRNPWLAGLGGLIFGLFSITRPNILVFFPFAVWWGAAVAKRMSPRRGAAFVTLLALGMLIPPASVTVRNAVVGRDWVVVAWQGGVNFYIGNNPESDGMEAVVPGTRHTWWGGYDDTVAIAESAAGRELKPSEIQAYWFRRGLAYIREEPLGWLRLTARKVVALVGAPEVPNNEPYEARRGNYAAFRLVPLSFAHLLGLFLASLPWMLKRPGRRARAGAAGPKHLQRGFVLLVLAFLLSYGASVVAFFVTGRYRVPLVPFVAMGAAFAAVTLYDRVRDGRLVQAGALCVASVALSWLLGVDHLHVREGTRDFVELSAAQDLLDTRDFWHATLAAFECEEWEPAAERVASFLSRRPDGLKALTVAFGAALMLGRTDEARAHLERVEALSPNDPTVARMRAGLPEFTAGRTH